ncbi:similar to Pc13g13620 [Aspergillus niger]|uniref:Similar to Pc13g13620 n=1 Tax=Aspergillus niger TaxID=5061 RepID=A0A124BXX8_ASPNG|nr:similar to Pc13g13620 [Aspergillus niger]
MEGGPSITDAIEEEDCMSSQNKYRSDYSDESDSEVGATWSPGDGICPSTAEFHHCCQSKFDEWSHATSMPLNHTLSFPFYLDAFLSLLKHVPPFLSCLPDDVHITGRRRTFLMLRSSLQIHSTDDPDCDQPYKLIDYLQCLGSPKPVVYKLKVETQLQPVLPIHTKAFRSGYFTNIVLAWSYIVSCRWSEICQRAGWNSQILHENGMQIEDSFWHLVTQGCWRALVKKETAKFCSPWMLGSEGAKKDCNWVPVTPDSSLAFDILVDFCISEGLEMELVTGLASVLLLTSRNTPSPILAPAVAAPTASAASPPRAKHAIEYCSSEVEKKVVTRAKEFQTSFYCRPGTSVPWSPAPPFGTTPVKNVSLEIRRHLGHMHRPISWTTCWVLSSGKRIPATKQYQIRQSQAQRVYHPSSTEHSNDVSHAEKIDADEQSAIATSRLFNWHRSYDDGIWLDDGTGDIETIRRIQQHQWMIDPFSASELDDLVEEPKDHELSFESILRWIDEAENHRH